jgi:hypothetical protein
MAFTSCPLSRKGKWSTAHTQGHGFRTVLCASTALSLAGWVGTVYSQTQPDHKRSLKA